MAKRRRLPLEQIQAFYFNKENNIAQAAKEIGCGTCLLRRELQEYGLKAKDPSWNRKAMSLAKKGKLKIHISREDIEKYYLSGPITLKQAVKSLHTSMATLVRSMKELNIPPKGKNWNRFVQETLFPSLDNKEFLQREMQAKTNDQIAKEQGCSVVHVYNHLVKFGLIDMEKGKKERKHNAFLRRHPNGHKTPILTRWYGDKRKYGPGYVKVFNPGHPFASRQGAIPEHRFVMEQFLGRYLTKEEVVHHRDQNKRNNDLTNLLLFSSNGQHIHFHQSIYRLIFTSRRNPQNLKNDILMLEKQYASPDSPNI